jgi:hypothetical protein
MYLLRATASRDYDGMAHDIQLGVFETEQQAEEFWTAWIARTTAKNQICDEFHKLEHCVDAQIPQPAYPDILPVPKWKQGLKESEITPAMREERARINDENQRRRNVHDQVFKDWQQRCRLEVDKQAQAIGFKNAVIGGKLTFDREYCVNKSLEPVDFCPNAPQPIDVTVEPSVTIKSPPERLEYWVKAYPQSKSAFEQINQKWLQGREEMTAVQFRAMHAGLEKEAMAALRGFLEGKPTPLENYYTMDIERSLRQEVRPVIRTDRDEDVLARAGLNTLDILKMYQNWDWRRASRKTPIPLLSTPPSVEF